MAESQYYVTGVALSQFYHGGLALGLDADTALAQAHLSLDHLAPTMHVPVAQYECVILALYEQYGKEILGAEIGQKIMLPLYEPLMSVLMNSLTLEDALQNLSKFFSLSTGNAGSLHYLKKKDEIHLVATMAHQNPTIRSIVSECVVALVLGLIRLVSTRPDLTYLHVNFQHHHKNQVDRLRVEDILGSRINWSQKEYGVCIDETGLQTKMINHGEAILKAATEQAEQKLKQITDCLSWEEIVKIHIKELMLTSSPRRETVAEHLDISSRTLDRKLKQHGMGWQELVDEARQELAIAYLTNEALTIVDISSKLGFTSVRSFQRRFKIWTGITASEYRAKL